ncbi:MAG: MFS transporter [Verrucomicrobia bacterium]|nr:MFS transporter [Verrucomicrobiota bacterium]
MKTSRGLEYIELAGLFFLQWMALSIWLVPLSNVLEAHGLHALRPYAFATGALAAIISPLIFGAMADRHFAPVRVLRWLAVATAAAMALATFSIQQGCSAGTVLGLIQVYSLCAAPSSSISTSIIFSRLQNPKREFGPIRATATVGWMCGCWLVSALAADASPLAGYASAATWLGIAAFTFVLPSVPPPETKTRPSWHERLGWDALVLLKNRDTRVVFLTAALYSIPLAAFYPFTPAQLKQLGFQHASAWMSLGQTTEIFAMLALAGLFLRVRLKWIFAAGMGFGLLRSGLSALDSRGWVLAGITMHGLAYTLFFIPAQIYVDERIDPAWRVRAQALFSLMTSGVGNLLGYLGTGWWFNHCTQTAGTRWPLFWGGLAAAVGGVMVYFVTAYRGRGPAKS